MLRDAGSYALRIVLVAVAYFLVGRLALQFANPPGYAAAVWPSAGIAMAAAILWGPRILPGVWLGSFGVNAIHDATWYVPAAIGLGAAAQAGVGAWLARRLAGPGNPLDTGLSMLRVLFVGGPLSCLVSASAGVGMLLATRKLEPGDAAFHWATWWTSETLGVLLFLPPLLAWTASPTEVWRLRRWTITGFLFACCTAVGLFFAYARSLEKQRVEDEFEDRQLPIAEAIQRELTRTAATVLGLASFFDASEIVYRDEFEVFTTSKLEEAPGLRALAWNPVVPAARRSEFEALARNDRIEDFVFRERGPDGKLEPAGARDRYVPVFYIEPAATNRDSLGFDIASEQVRGEAVKAAIDRAAPTATARIQLLHETEGAWSVLLMMAVYKAPKTPPTFEERRATVEGFAVGVVRLIDLVEHALAGLDSRGLDIRIRDLDGAPGEQLLYGDEPTEASSYPALEVRQDAGRNWKIEISPSGPPHRPWSTWFVLAGGLLFTGFVEAFVLEATTRRIHVERLVALRTRELARANDELQRSNIELQRFAHVASHDLREPLRAIGTYAQLLDESSPELLPPHRKFLDRIQGASRRMQALVDDLLALSRIEGGAGKLESVPLRELVDRALANLQPAIDAANARVQIGELPVLPCDPSQIVQLFQNLIANAVKFRREGVRPLVSIGCRRAGDLWECAVRDNGIGIAAEHRERVFEMFERLHARERYGGTGIGLAICRRVVDRHGGGIWLESPAEGGSVFRFTLRAEEQSG